MTGEATLAVAYIFVALLAALAIVALVSRRFAVPYTVALIVLGLIVSVVSPSADVALTPELVLAVLVPGLVFEAALRMDLTSLRHNLSGVALLAIPGVLIVAVTVAAVLHFATGMSMASAFLVGAMVSATDPVAVIATMRQLRAPDRLAGLVEAESLFNDGTGVVLFTVAVAGTDLLGAGLLEFSLTIVISVCLGLVSGGAAGWVASRLGDVNLELTLTVLCAYGTYLAADALGQSGIIATVVAGVVLGNYEPGIPPRARVAVDSFWTFVAFVLTAITFLLIGLTIKPPQLLGSIGIVAWGVIAVLAGRALVVYGLLGGVGRTMLGRRLRLAMPTGWLHIIFWSGLRGAIAVALALSVPGDRPDRGLLQGIVFGIVLFTLLVQGGTAGLLLRWAQRRGDMEDGHSVLPSQPTISPR